jgi:Mn2+/Fe2+ NRAMP family transporter
VPRIACDSQGVSGRLLASSLRPSLLWALSVSDFLPSRRWRDLRHAFAETLGWRQGLDKDLKQARAFYALILLSTGAGGGLDFVGINPVKALYWTAVINGLLAPFLLVAILAIASDRKLMQGQPSSRLGWAVVAITTVAMFAAGIAVFVV